MQPPEPSSLTEKIKEKALQLGFHAVGIAPISALENRNRELAHWLLSGHAGKLQYMEAFFQRQGRFLCRFPDLKSIVVLAVSYGLPQGSLPASSQENRPAYGRIARYAQGKDYHRVIEKRLKKLGDFIRTQGKDPLLLRCVDTGPIPERVLAEAAGIGFFGKNTCLIRPGLGSCLFLAALLTDLELTPDNPIHWDCGSCTLCLEACPTQALRAPYELDARRCISYLTIELKDSIEPALRPLMGDWLFGCDICQEVCPYNRKTKAIPWKEFQPEVGEGESGKLAEILKLSSQEEFLNRFSGTPLTRAKRAGLLRNAAVVAGNLKDPNLVPVLNSALRKDPSSLVRQHAAWALSQIDTLDAQQALAQALVTEKEEEVRAQIKEALLKQVPTEAVS